MCVCVYIYIDIIRSSVLVNDNVKLQAVIKRLMTDVPFGVLLSGGLDSSLVASITARHLSGTKAAKQWGAQLHSFCVGLEVIR